MKLLNKYKYLIIIIILASFLRLWQLGNVPPSPDWDEAALGYNAYSILKTGRDEYGTWLPLTLRSFDDYKPPLYMYLTVPSVAIFGLNTWSVRLPSAILGILAVIGTYLLGKQFGKKLNLSGELPALLLAISPWHLQFSRIAFEANIGVTLNIFGLVFFLHGLRSRRWLSFSAFLFGLALYAYHSERIFVPLLVGLLFLFFRGDLLKDKKSLIIAMVVGLLTILPLATVFLNQNTLTRLRGTSSLADQTALLARSVNKLEMDQVSGNIWGQIFDNRRLVWVKTLADGYLSHFSLRWLFLTGDNPRHHAPDMGLMYLWEMPFLFWGIYAVFVFGGPLSWLMFGWLLIAPIAASPTTELPHAIRTLVFLPVLQIFTAIGLTQFMGWVRKFKQVKIRFFMTIVIIGLIIFNLIYYFHMYYGHMNYEFSKFWQFGYQKAVEYASQNKSNYKKIVVSTKLEQPHMFFLFYTQYNPLIYLKEGGTSSGGFAELKNKFDNFEFRPINWSKEIKDGTILYIGTPGEIPNANLSSIQYLDGSEAMRIADR